MSFCTTVQSSSSKRKLLHPLVEGSAYLGQILGKTLTGWTFLVPLDKFTFPKVHEKLAVSLDWNSIVNSAKKFEHHLPS